MRCCNVKGFILKVNEKEGTAQAQGEDGSLYENVLLINPFGTHSIPEITDNMEVLIMKSMGTKDVVLGLPFNYIKKDILPAEKQGDYTVGSVVGRNYTQYKENGEILSKAKSIANESISGGQVNIDALIEIKNEAVNLKDILNQILTACQSITITDPQLNTPIPINNAPAFASIIPLLTSLLK